MDVWIQKTLKYAVYSNVAIQLGKNVRVVGDIASTYTGTNKGPPIQMFSDFHYLPNMSSLDNELATFRGLLNTYDTSFANRLDVRNSGSAAATAAAAAGLYDANGDGFIDDYDIALMNLDSSWSKTTPYANAITTGRLHQSVNTGKRLRSRICGPRSTIQCSAGARLASGPDTTTAPSITRTATPRSSAR